jgi:glucan-binding YG repeat protein
MAIMSSYNKINGEWSGSNYDLLTDIARGEWNFKGLVMTDWYSGANPADSMHDGNDLIMPGGSQDTILSAVEELAPTFGEDGYVTTTTKLYQDESGFHSGTIEQWNDFTPSADGTVTVTTQVAAEVTFNDKAIKMVSEGIASITNESGDSLDVTTGAAVSFNEPTNITYKGSYADNNTIYLGDLQKSAMRVLNMIMQSSQFAKMNADKGVTAKSYEEQFNDLKNYLTLTKGDVATGGSGSDGTTTGGSESSGTTTSSSSSHHHSNSSSSSDSSSSSTGSSNSSSNDKAADVKKQWNKNADGTWSFINPNGQKAIGWVQDGNSWYHLDSSGIMQKGWIKDANGLWYYLNSDGAMKTGWLKDTNGKWYYLDASGSMKTGWFSDTDGKWYYLYANGEMAADTTIDGYAIDSTGAWIS